MTRTVALCLFLLLWSGVAVAQTAAPGGQTFRSDIEAVEIDVRVVDQDGRPVAGLTAADFELFEDGVRQEIRLATAAQVPVVARPRTRAWIEPDTQTNRVPFDGRVYAFVLDDLHTHPLRANRVKAVVRQFIEKHFAANDRAALVVTSGRGAATQELTGSPSAILQALDAFSGRKLRSVVLDRIDEYYRLRNVRELESNENSSGRNSRIDDPNEFERAYQARQALTTLRDVTRWLETVPARRKALIFVSEGMEYDLRTLVENRFASGLLADLQDAVAGAARGNTTIYAVDPRGLGGMEDEKIELSSLPDDTTELGQGAFAATLRATQENLQLLAEQTGGFALVNTNDLARGFDRLVRDNSEYYVLGYQSTNTKRDGRFRRVEVRLRRPGLRAIARRGYFARKEEPAAPGKTASPLKALLDSPLPVQGLPITSHVAVFRGDDGKGSALVTVELGPGLGFRLEDEISKGRVDLAVIAVDERGKIAASEDRGLDMNLRYRTRLAVDEHGMRTTARLALKPGRYQVRVAAHDRTSGKGGSVLHDVVVPDFAASPIAVSQVLVTSLGALSAATVNADEQLKGAIRLPPTASRTFVPADEISVFAEVYDNRTDDVSAVRVQTVVVDGDGKVAYRAEERIDASAFEPKRRAFRHRTDIPIKQLPAGEYVVRVLAEPQRPGVQPAAREVVLAVRPGENTAS